MPTRFLVRDVFAVAGRGAVAAGDVLGGSVVVGMETQPLELGGQPLALRVGGVERMRPVSPELAVDLGLLFEGVEPDVLRRALPPGSVLVLSQS